MERMGTCGVCGYYKSKVEYTDSSEGQCSVDGPGQSKWVGSRDTCDRHEENLDMAIMYLQQGLEEVQARLRGFLQQIDDCEARIVEDKDLIRQVEPRETELLAELEKRGMVEDDGDD